MRAAIVTATMLLGCNDDRPDVRREFPPPRLSVIAAKRGETLDYRGTSRSAVQFRLGTKKSHVEGSVRGGDGELSFDAADLRTLRGEIRFDLSTLTITGASDDTLASLLDTAGAFALLDLDQDRQRLRRARFRIEKVLSASAQVPRTGKKVSEPDAETLRYTVELEVRGNLDLHGYRTEQDLTLNLVATYATTDPQNAPPRSITIGVESVSLGLDTFGIEPERVDPETEKQLRTLFRRARLEAEAHFIPSRDGAG